MKFKYNCKISILFIQYKIGSVIEIKHIFFCTTNAKGHPKSKFLIHVKELAISYFPESLLSLGQGENCTLWSRSKIGKYKRTPTANATPQKSVTSELHLEEIHQVETGKKWRKMFRFKNFNLSWFFYPKESTQKFTFTFKLWIPPKILIIYNIWSRIHENMYHMPFLPSFS